MGYYMRVFSKNDSPPPISSILQAFERQGRHIEIEAESAPSSPLWERATIVYKAEKLPILVECNRDNSTDNSLFKEEICEFLAAVGPAGLSLSKHSVISYLKKAKLIVACQIPTSDIDDYGYEVVGEFLAYVRDSCHGIIQADLEGFYSGDKLIVRV